MGTFDRVFQIVDIVILGVVIVLQMRMIVRLTEKLEQTYKEYKELYDIKTWRSI